MNTNSHRRQCQASALHLREAMRVGLRSLWKGPLAALAVDAKLDILASIRDFIDITSRLIGPVSIASAVAVALKSP
jgi:hypothetical protein